MRCAVLGCIKNENGYCLDSSYVQITKDGECDSILVIEEEPINEDT
jgi:hypothetical protein